MAEGDDDEDDEDLLETTMTSERGVPVVDPSREIAEVLGDLEIILKNGDVIAALTTRNINSSLALLIVNGLRSYLAGQKMEAAEDLATAAEEITARAASGSGTKPS